MKTEPRCRCCTHPRRAELDLALMRGARLKEIAQVFGVPISSASRHRMRHLTVRVVRPNERPASELERDGLRDEPEPPEDRPTAADVARGLLWATRKAAGMVDEAEGRGDIRLAVAALRAFIEAQRAIFESLVAWDLDAKLDAFRERFG